MWDRYHKIGRDNIGRKIRSTGYIYLPGSKYREAEEHLKMRSCFQYFVINSTPRIGKYLNKMELYKQLPPRKLKDKKMTEIENTSFVINVMKVTPVIRIEIEDLGSANIIRRFYDIVYICTCSLRSDEYMCKTKHAFLMAFNSKHCINKNVMGISLII